MVRGGGKHSGAAPPHRHVDGPLGVPRDGGCERVEPEQSRGSACESGPFQSVSVLMELKQQQS